MTDLIIGSTSQLANYLPIHIRRIQSRNIKTDIFENNYNNVFLTFAEQRTFNKNLNEKDFIDVNVHYTSKIIDKLNDKCKRIIIYGTAELWNAHNGPININTEIKYNYNPYVKSKEVLYNLVLEKRNKNEWENVIVIHPMNFNSIGRKKGFLFFKIFDSILKETIINVGDLNIDRDIIHAKYLAYKSLSCENDSIIGSGYTTNIREFVISLYSEFDLEYSKYVRENKIKSPHKNNRFWLETSEKYCDLLLDTIEDIKKIKNQ
jgi:hypothetical protein